jgi:hypothetical protein
MSVRGAAFGRPFAFVAGGVRMRTLLQATGTKRQTGSVNHNETSGRARRRARRKARLTLPGRPGLSRFRQTKRRETSTEHWAWRTTREAVEPMK